MRAQRGNTREIIIPGGDESASLVELYRESGAEIRFYRQQQWRVVLFCLALEGVLPALHLFHLRAFKGPVPEGLTILMEMMALLITLAGIVLAGNGHYRMALGRYRVTDLLSALPPALGASFRQGVGYPSFHEGGGLLWFMNLLLILSGLYVSWYFDRVEPWFKLKFTILLACAIIVYITLRVRAKKHLPSQEDYY